MDPTTLGLLLAIVLGAHFVETATGFGATVIAVALGVHLLPLDRLLVSLVLLAWLQSAYLIARHHRHIDWRVLGTRIVPAAGVGLAIGSVLFRTLALPMLQTVLGGFVIGVAALQLWQLWRRGSLATALPAPAGLALLAGGGVFHGLFASGGPLIVYYASRALPDKAVFRVTLSCLWLVLNTVLLISYAFSGTLRWDPVQATLWLVPGLLGGIVLGESLHHRLPETGFRLVVQAVLLVTGVSLLL